MGISKNFIMTESNTPSDQLTLFAEVFLASPSQQQENETEQAMIATSGLKCLESFEKLNQPGLLEKTLLASCRWTTGLYSSRYALRWKMKATPYKRLYFQLFPSERRTEEIGFGLLRTPTAAEAKDQSCSSQVYIQDQLKAASGLAATPNARDWKGVSGYKEQKDLSKDIANLLPTPRANKNTPQQREDFSPNLSTVLSLLPTPKKQNANSPAEHGQGGKDLQTTLHQIGESTGMKLQPNFVEWMMGFPENWTNLEIPTGQTASKPSETL